jgi:hypothetical protein
VNKDLLLIMLRKTTMPKTKLVDHSIHGNHVCIDAIPSFEGAKKGRGFRNEAIFYNS